MEECQPEQLGSTFTRQHGECGYSYVASVDNLEDLQKQLQYIAGIEGPVFLEVKVKIGARADLGRPKESAVENKENFMKYHFPEVVD